MNNSSNLAVKSGLDFKKIFLLFLFIGLVILIANDGSSQGMPWEGPLTTIKKSITGPVASIIALLGIVAAGVGLLFGAEFSGFVKSLFGIVLVVALIIGAANILALFDSSGATISSINLSLNNSNLQLINL